MKTITIRNLALAQRSVQLVIRLIPYVKKHFEGCLRKTEGTQAESKQIETFRKQFDQVSHLESLSECFCYPDFTWNLLKYPFSYFDFINFDELV